jgi:hypothetical protein
MFSIQANDEPTALWEFRFPDYTYKGLTTGHHYTGTDAGTRVDPTS